MPWSFATDGLLLDMRPMRQVLDFDPAAGTVECGAGIEWRELIGDYLARRWKPPSEAA